MSSQHLANLDGPELLGVSGVANAASGHRLVHGGTASEGGISSKISSFWD